ncbi:Coiled-coil domain-containing protein, partial [Globisporangium splendens]
MIEAVLLVSRQGKTRLSKWYLAASLKEKTRMIREITSLVLSRPQKQCNFIEFKDKKIVYKRYASLFFIACISKDENELITLESIHMFVEVLDRYFGNAYYILDEMFIGGFQVESSKKEVLRICTAQEDYMDESKEEGFLQMRVSYIRATFLVGHTKRRESMLENGHAFHDRMKKQRWLLLVCTAWHVLVMRTHYGSLTPFCVLDMCVACVRKTLFRATAGLTLDEQLKVAGQLHSSGVNVLQHAHAHVNDRLRLRQRIDAMKKTSKKQKQVTKANQLKFEWLQEHSQLKKLEEVLTGLLYSYDESLLLRMHNDASAETAALGSVSKKGMKKCGSGPLSPELDASNDEDCNNNGSYETIPPPTDASSMASYDQYGKAPLRFHLIHPLLSQQLAMKQLLGAIKDKQRDAPAVDKSNQLRWDEDMKSNAQHLIMDAVIGHQMVETLLEEEAAKCNEDFLTAYNAVLASLREDRRGRSGSVAAANLVETEQQFEQKISELVDSLGGKDCPDELLRLEIVDEFRTLHIKLRDNLLQYKGDFISLASMADAAGSAEAATSKTGGWSSPDDERFLKVLKSYERKGGPAKKAELLYDQVKAVVPHMSVLEIKKHVKFHHHLRFYQEKCRDQQKEFERRHRELEANVRERLQTVIRIENEKQTQLAQFRALQKNCDRLHDKVAEWKVSKDAKERIEHQQREVKQLLQAQRQQEDALKWKKKLEKQKRLVDDYKKSKVLDEIAGEKLSDEEMLQREAEKAAQWVCSTGDVTYDNLCGASIQQQRKLEGDEQEQLRKAHEEEVRIAKLNALKGETPYAQIIATIVVRSSQNVH